MRVGRGVLLVGGSKHFVTVCSILKVKSRFNGNQLSVSTAIPSSSSKHFIERIDPQIMMRRSPDKEALSPSPPPPAPVRSSLRTNQGHMTPEGGQHQHQQPRKRVSILRPQKTSLGGSGAPRPPPRRLVSSQERRSPRETTPTPTEVRSPTSPEKRRTPSSSRLMVSGDGSRPGAVSPRKVRMRDEGLLAACPRSGPGSNSHQMQDESTQADGLNATNGSSNGNDETNNLHHGSSNGARNNRLVVTAVAEIIILTIVSVTCIARNALGLIWCMS